MGAQVGRECKVSLGDTKTLGLGTWNISGIDIDTFDDSEFGDTYKTYKVALREGGTLSFDGYYDPTDSTGQTQMKTYWQNGTNLTSLRFYTDSTSYWGSFAMDETCDSISGWADRDVNAGGGAGAASTQESNPLGGSLETYKFTATTAGAGTYARRLKSFGDVFSATTRIDIKTYFDEIDTLAAGDYFEFLFFPSATLGFRVRFASDGLYIYDGSNDNEVGVNIVSENAWATWRFDIHHRDSDALATCDVYKDGTIQANGVDCSWISQVDQFGFRDQTGEDKFGFDDQMGFETELGATVGDVQLTQYCDTQDANITYVDFLRAQTGHVNVTSWDVTGDKSALMAASFTGKITGRLALQ